MVKNVPVNSGNAGDASSVPEWGRSPRGVNGNPLQDSFLENPMDNGVWQATVHGVTRVRHNLATNPPTTKNTTKKQSLSCKHLKIKTSISSD